ncbi:hypothetical protein TTRE_0000820901 [Trichuris trichiura]|uniref:Uncharacterized protein n=1 Tax=Trichuris trichiura TaxID=36087 RepID=A0A077ZHL4_TRITR|nr:hypothetical protein TTRE_0000820901 [Trichuris trichiura]
MITCAPITKSFVFGFILKEVVPDRSALTNIRSVTAQLSLLPTLAMLLGIPIPFSNLGAFIPELFTDSNIRLQAARVNVYQSN